MSEFASGYDLIFLYMQKQLLEKPKFHQAFYLVILFFNSYEAGALAHQHISILAY